MVRSAVLAVIAAGSLIAATGCKKEQPSSPSVGEATREAAKPAAEVPAETGSPEQAGAEVPANTRHVAVEVTNEGFVPSRIDATVGETVVLDITRKTDETCANNLMIPDKGVKLDLPLNETVSVPVEVGQAGTIKFGCQMGMMIGGVIVAK